MLAWPRSGFHVNHSVRLEADDALGILQLARYAARAPIALERLQYDARKQQVTLVSDKRAGPTAGTHSFPVLEFLAMLLAHVPDCHERLIREYGAYSSRRRARWRRQGILTDTRPLAEVPPANGDATPDWPALRALRQRCAVLLKRIFEVDALRCPRCGTEMRMLAFILDPDVIAAILRHLRRKGRDPRALPEHLAARGRSRPALRPLLPAALDDSRLTHAPSSALAGRGSASLRPHRARSPLAACAAARTSPGAAPIQGFGPISGRCRSATIAAAGRAAATKRHSPRVLAGS